MMVGRFIKCSVLVIKHFGLVIMWVLTIVAMKLDDLNDPFDSQRLAHPNGHNGAGAFIAGVVWISIELVVLQLILRPWSYQRSWGRSLCALMVSIPWLGFSVLMMMHGGGIVRLHALWILVIAVAMLTVTFFSAIAADRHREDALKSPLVVPAATVMRA
jgi:hypothetical protein